MEKIRHILLLLSLACCAYAHSSLTPTAADNSTMAFPAEQTCFTFGFQPYCPDTMMHCQNTLHCGEFLETRNRSASSIFWDKYINRDYCKTEEDCDVGERCQNGVCTRNEVGLECDSDEECLAGHFCHPRRRTCEFEKGLNNRCHYGTLECRAGLVCEDEVCVEPTLDLVEFAKVDSRPFKSLPKYYATASIDKPPSYWDCESIKLNFKSADKYEDGRHLGSGTYSDVYEGVNLETNQKVAMKVLQPVQLFRVKREIKILQALQGGPNIVEYIEVAKDDEKNLTGIITEFVEGGELDDKLFAKFNEFDIKYYMFGILKALDYANSKGIMHRDIKPPNIVIDHKNRKMRVLDWGISDFYFPGLVYGVKVASRRYKAPELLVGYNFYDYSLDMWSVGCTFAWMIINDGGNAMFPGEDNIDQLIKIAEVLGTEELVAYLDKYKIALPKEFSEVLGIHPKIPWTSFIDKYNKQWMTEDAIDLLSQMLRYDHAERITPKDAMEHPYFKEVREFYANQK